ncbi:MAG: DUF4124 domain-containing protein [Pseudomonadota bacterium]
MVVKFILVIALSILPQIAFSQIFKCKHSTGKLIYSEEPCPAGTKGSELYLEPNTISSSPVRRNITTQKTNSDTNSDQNTASNSDSLDNIMSEYDRQNRIWGLQIDMKNNNGYYEKQADARNEHAWLLKNPVHNLTYDNELKRSNLKVDLTSTNSLTRSNALQLLAALYFKYQYP